MGQIARAINSKIADGFHGGVRKINGLLGAVGDAKLIEGVLETHDAKTDRSMAHIRGARLLYRVVVNVDDIIEHAYCRAHGGLQLLHV